MMSALLDDEAARCDVLADEFGKAIDRAVSIPSNIVEQFEGVTTDCETEQVGFGFKTFATSWLVERNSRQLCQALQILLMREVVIRSIHANRFEYFGAAEFIRAPRIMSSCQRPAAIKRKRE